MLATDDALAAALDASEAASAYLGRVHEKLRAALVVDGRVDAGALQHRQTEAHGYAWLATVVEAIRRLVAWAEAREASGGLDDAEERVLVIGLAEYLAQVTHGIVMAPDEVVRPAHFGLEAEARRLFDRPSVRSLFAAGTRPEVRRELVALFEAHGLDSRYVRDGLDDTHAMVREQFRRFADDRIVPYAQGWHVRDALIPDDVIASMAELGVFGITVAEADGGLGMGTAAMCVVTEELSRGYLGVGSLGTRSEIACHLLLDSGTPAQRDKYLAPIIAGTVIPTAVFTEPEAGSDLASLKTRAERAGDVYRLHGAKTWSTHAARADLMTVLARTDTGSTDHRGLSLFLAEKPRGADADPFPVAGMSGSEIPVLGYRGMKEYTIGFDGFAVPAANLLGGAEGQGFRQLMATFEGARIQTAARAVGVAQNALELAFAYARERIQFGRPILEFPRVYNKIAWMAVELAMVRQLVYAAAAKKDGGVRSDVEAGMAKLVGARTAWSAADNAVQIHGGNGYAIEYPISRVLCDARILSIFEGAAEIQAQIIARGLLQARA